MTVGSHRSRVRMVSRLVVPLALMVPLVLSVPAGFVLAQIDPQVRDRIVPAIVEIAIILDVTENGSTEPTYLPVGSGTIISPDGLILTNWHVVDMAAHRAQLDAWEAQAESDGESLAFVLDQDRVLILGTDGASAPEPIYVADVVAEHHALDLAVLRITGDEYGATLSSTPTLAFVPLGDSSSLRQGDPVNLFGYPTIGGGTLTYTNGVVSGFNFEEGIDGPAWITTNATMAGGSSGGAALDRVGRLIGVPTQGTALDCRPGDTNGDGTIDAEDVGCIPMGGSIGQLRPINVAKPLLAEAGWKSIEEVAEPPETEVLQPMEQPDSSNDESVENVAPETTPSPAVDGVPEPDAREQPAGSSNVPMYRGNPARTGEMPGPDPQGQLGELWRVDFEQGIQSSPAVVSGVVFIGTGTMADEKGFVVALEAATGTEIWRFEGAPFLASPAVSDDRVYIASLDGYLYVLDASKGKVVSRFDATGDGDCFTGLSSPVVDETRVLIGVSCIDPQEGSGYYSRVGNIVAFDKASGSVLWKFTTKGGFDEMVSLATDDGIVVISDLFHDSGSNGYFGPGTTYAVDATTGLELWRFEANTGFTSTPVIHAGMVFVVGLSGELFALNLLTGSEQWRFTLGEALPHSAAASDGVVYAGTSKRFYAIEAITGTKLWEIDTEARFLSSPVVTESAIYLGGWADYVAVIDRKTGASGSDKRIPLDTRLRPLVGSPAVSEGTLFAAAGTGYVIALGDLRTIVLIAEGMMVEVVGDVADLRAAPSRGAVLRGELQPGIQLRVTGPAEKREGQMWWPLEAAGIGTGWVPESAIVAAEVTPTPIPKSTPRSTSTPGPTSDAVPTSTVVPAATVAVVPERNSEPAEPDRDISAANLPLLDLLPTRSQVPKGLILADEAERSKAEVVQALGGTEEASQLLDDWGWSGNAFRDFIGDDTAVPPGGTTFLNASVHRFANPRIGRQRDGLFV